MGVNVIDKVAKFCQQLFCSDHRLIVGHLRIFGNIRCIYVLGNVLCISLLDIVDIFPQGYQIRGTPW